MRVFEGFAFGKQHEDSARLRRLERGTQHEHGHRGLSIHGGWVLRLLEIRRRGHARKRNVIATQERNVNNPNIILIIFFNF